ncbi:MAG: phage tail protein [Novosphingobium sp.]|nr:phage tail protein [Novosphingobium sp.]
MTQRREPAPVRRDTALHYYDVARDYQPGLQRARGRSHAGEPATIEFPAALAADAAAALADGIASRTERARDTATCRIASGSSAFAPGRLVGLPGAGGSWLVESWELGRDGVELGLRRIHAGSAAVASAADPGRASPPPDLAPTPSLIAAFELPWDGIGNPGDARLFAALSAAGSGWRGAALFVERPDGGLDPLGGSGRVRAVMGSAETALGLAPAAAPDFANVLDVALAAPDLALASASATQLAAGANRALVGDELLQFARADALGSGRWRLRGLLRGRGGTEWAIAGHAAGERFVLIDDALVALDPAVVGDSASARIAALGLGDAEPVDAAIALPGVSLQPLSPVHGALTQGGDGGLSLAWVRRARGAWLWRDGVDVPLVEQSESYLVSFGPIAAPHAQWLTSAPALTLDAAAVAALRAQAPGAPFNVRQRGDHNLSAPLPLGMLP